MYKELIEERFFTTIRWKEGRECLNLKDINEIPPSYANSAKEWLQELTTFIFLYPKEWKEIYEEYLYIVNHRNIIGQHILYYYRDDEGYIRKIGEQDIFLKINVKGSSDIAERFIKKMDWNKLISFEEYIEYTELKGHKRKIFIGILEQRLQSFLSLFNKKNDSNLKADVCFVCNPDESIFMKQEIFIDPLNDTYFIL